MSYWDWDSSNKEWLREVRDVFFKREGVDVIDLERFAQMVYDRGFQHGMESEVKKHPGLVLRVLQVVMHPWYEEKKDGQRLLAVLRERGVL